MTILRVENLSISFASRDAVTPVVHNVSFDLNDGEILGIVGESGSGKSVTCYSLLGLLQKPAGSLDSGSAIFEGVDLLALNEKQIRQYRGLKISMIFQDPMTSLNPYMTIGQQITEALRAHAKLSKKDAQRQAIDSLKEVGIRDVSQRINAYPHEFSGGMRQRVMIAMALATQPDILIADEPTTALDVTIQAQVLQLLADIQSKRQLSIIFITHDLAVVHRIADSVLVMEKGRIVERGDPKQLFAQPQHEYTKKLIAAIPNSAKQETFLNDPKADVVLEVERLNTYYQVNGGVLFGRHQSVFHAVKDVSLKVRRGEIMGLVGESGSGKSSLGRTIMRLVHSESGSVILDGTDLLKLQGAQLKSERQHFQMIFQDPYASLNPRMTVFNILAEPLLLGGKLERKVLDQKINQLMDDVGLERQAIRRYPHEFSGGQRQRIAIARALATNPKLIVADEPVSALDVTIQKQILELLLRLSKERQLTMIFISHDLSVVRYVCDSVAVMNAGELVEMGECETIFDRPQHEYTRKLVSAIPVIQH